MDYLFFSFAGCKALNRRGMLVSKTAIMPTAKDYIIFYQRNRDFPMCLF